MVDEPANASTPPLVLGRYLLGAQLGQGGMGRVHAATDTRLGRRKVAVKTLALPDVAPDMKAELVERFKREPEMLALIKHKHVVDVLDYGCDADGTLYLVTELLEGDTLHDHLYASGEPFPIAQAAELALELCAGIQACHANGVIHRDLKPANVFLVKAQTGAGLEVKIIDFGLAKGQHAQRITRAGIVPGTLRFFSPEQAAGEEATEQSDQYSIALCLYFCLTGHEPYDQIQGNPLELIRAIHNGEFPRPHTYRELPSPSRRSSCGRCTGSRPSGSRRCATWDGRCCRSREPLIKISGARSTGRTRSPCSRSRRRAPAPGGTASGAAGADPARAAGARSTSARARRQCDGERGPRVGGRQRPFDRWSRARHGSPSAWRAAASDPAFGICAIWIACVRS